MPEDTSLFLPTKAGLRLEAINRFKKLSDSRKKEILDAFISGSAWAGWRSAKPYTEIINSQDFIDFLVRVLGISGPSTKFVKEVSPLENLSFNLSMENLAILGIGLGGIYLGPKKGGLALPAKLIGYGGTALGITSILGLFTLGDLRRMVGI